MPAQHLGRYPSGHIPDGHQRICASTDQVHAIWTPVDLVDADGIALHNAQALPTRHIPHAQGAVFPTTEQTRTVGGEGQAVHGGAMST